MKGGIKLLVAEKKAYNYSDILYEQERENKRINKRLEEQKKKRALLKKRRAFFSTTILSFLSLVIVSSIIFLLMRYSYINEMKYSIQKLEEKIVHMEDDYQLQKVKLEEYTMSSIVEAKALEELNMNYPQPDQRGYLEMNNDIRNTIKANASAEGQVEDDSVIKRLFKKLLTKFD